MRGLGRSSGFAAPFCLRESLGPDTGSVVISFMGVFAFNYAFTQTLLATNPELQSIR